MSLYILTITRIPPLPRPALLGRSRGPESRHTPGQQRAALRCVQTRIHFRVIVRQLCYHASWSHLIFTVIILYKLLEKVSLFYERTSICNRMNPFTWYRKFEYVVANMSGLSQKPQNFLEPLMHHSVLEKTTHCFVNFPSFKR